MDLSLHGLFEAQAVRTPKATAVVSESGHSSYAALDAHASELAHRLGEFGVRRGDLVAVAMNRSPRLVASMLSVLKSGAAFLPVDTSYPAERIASILADARPAALLSDQATVPRLPGTLRPLLVNALGSDRSGITRPGLVTLPDEVAYVIYTSGSTGRPKGVVISHRSIVNYLTWQLRTYPLTTSDRVLQKAPTGFDGAVLEFFLPLCAGAALVLADQDSGRELKCVAELIAREHVTVAQFVPSMLPVLLDDELAPLCQGLKRVYSASDTLPVAVNDRFLRRFDTELVNLYGPTEATIDAAHWRCVLEPAATSVPVGREVSGIRIDVLDPRLRRAAAREVGEIYLAGIQLARGYLHRPGLTAHSFVADPHGAPGQRMYRTGDLGFKREDGVLEFVGRADSQVKIRGVRVEPAEIEAALAAHPGIRQAAAKAVTTPSGERRLAAYVVTAGQASMTPEAIRAYLGERLPEAAVPTYVVLLDSLPVSPNEKLDRAALPPPEFAGQVPDRDGEGEHADGTEEAFFGVVRDILSVPIATRGDSFIGLGGDSISAIRLASRARQAGFSITAGDALRHKTLGDLLGAAQIGAGAAPAADQAGPGSFSPTPIMRWLSDLGGPVESFSQSMVLYTPADASRDELLTCLQAVLDHHDMLRARFPDPAEWTTQTPEVLDPGVVAAASALETVDASALADPELRLLIRAGFERAMAKLSLGDPKMLHAIWYRRGAGRRGRLALLVHHLVIDGVSLRVLQADLADAWRTLRYTGAPQLAPVPVSFRRWAELLGQDALGSRRRSELSHWLRTADAGTRSLADREPDPKAETLGTARTRRFELSPRDTDALLSRAPFAYRTEVNTLLVTALALALAEWCQPAARFTDRDFLIAMESHGREPILPGVDPGRTIGWFTAMFPVRLRLTGIEARAADRPASSLRRAVDRIGAQLAAIPDKGIGYGLLRYLNPDTSAALAALPGRPDLLFNYLGRFPEAGAADWAFDADHDVAMDEADKAMPLAFAIEVNCLIMPRGRGQVLSAVWQWADSLVDGAAACRLAELWLARLADLARPGEPERATTSSHPDPIEAEFSAF